ncbi:MAG: hypothetical protein GC158_11750 [Cyanobacteria bacterium RI_101]|nr:hypothetical protein [Cyanobacteria bacterium RI_101]
MTRNPLLSLTLLLSAALPAQAQLLPPPPVAPNPTPPPGRFNPPPLNLQITPDTLGRPLTPTSQFPTPSPQPLPSRISELSPAPFPSGARPYNSAPSAPSPATLRVLALISSPVQEQQIRALFPDAFGTAYQGRRALQVGRFSDQANAREIAQNLQGLGVKTILVP